MGVIEVGEDSTGNSGVISKSYEKKHEENESKETQPSDLVP